MSEKSRQGPDGRVWNVRRVPFGIGVTKPPKPSRRPVAREARGADRGLVDRYLDVVMSTRFLVFVGTCAALALLLGYLTGRILAAAVGVAIVVAVILLPVLLFVAGVIALWLLGGVAGLLFLGGLVYGALWLAENPAVAIGLAIALALGSIVLVRGSWTVEAVCTHPNWKAVRWRVRGRGSSERVLRDVCDAVWRGNAETFHPSGASPPEVVGR